MLIAEKNAVYRKLLYVPTEAILRVESKPNWKDRESSNDERLKGNGLFNKQLQNQDNLEVIWDKYTQSIAWAPKDSEELALGYANRSALLLHVSKYQEAIVDIDRAIDITKSNALKVKWLCRKAKCLIYIERPSDAEKVLQEAELLVKTVDKDANKLIELIQNTRKLLRNKNFKQDNISKKTSLLDIKKKVNDFRDVAVVNDPKNKKYLIATRDIEPGEFVFVEKPFVTSIVSYKSAHPFCSHCSAICLTTIPCDSCCWCMYCSKKCKNEAWSQYHDTECLALGDYLHEMEITHLISRTALFLLIKECRKAGGISNFKALIESIDKKKETFTTDLTNIKSLPNYEFENVFKNSLTEIGYKFSEIFTNLAICLLLSLAKYTNFFGKKFNVNEYENFVNNDDMIFAAAIIKKFLIISLFGTAISNRNDTKSFVGVNRGLLISMTDNLMNHSCNPNVLKVFTKDTNMAVYAVTKIKKGDQILSTYLKKMYYTSKKDERQKEFLSTYGITCNCEACENDWPALAIAGILLQVVYPLNFSENIMDFFELPLEVELYKKHKTIILSCLKNKHEFLCTEEVMKDLAGSLAKVSEELSKPSMITCFLSIAFHKVFSNLYNFQNVF